MMIVCPECGKATFYNPYFRRDNCRMCGWLGDIRPPEQVERPRPRRLTKQEKTHMVQSFRAG